MSFRRFPGGTRSLPVFMVVSAIIVSGFLASEVPAASAQAVGTPTPIAEKTLLPGLHAPTVDVGAASLDGYEPDNSAATTTNTITPGTTQTHSISPAGDQDWIRFDLTTTSAVVLETSPTTPMPLPGYDTEMWLYDSGLNQIDYNDDLGPGYDFWSRIVRPCGMTALPKGTYYVKIIKRTNDVEIPSYDFTYTVTNASCPTNTDVAIAGANAGSYWVDTGHTMRTRYPAVNNGPVLLTNTSHSPLMASQRVAYTPNGGATWTSYGEMMGLPAGQITDTYYFPWYNSVNLSSQISVGNVGSEPTTVTVTIGGTEVDSYSLLASASKRVKYPSINSGPVVIHSSGSVPIITSERIAYTPDGTHYTGYAELMGLPASQLTDTYYFSYYNSVNLSEQVSVGNVGLSDTTVTITIGGTPVDSYVLTPSQSRRVKYFGLNTGPVVVHSSDGVPIIASERIAFTPDAGATYTGYSELMGLPSARLTDTYYFPWYNSVNHSMQVSAANVGSSSTTITVTIGGTQVDSYTLDASASKRVKYFSTDTGPVVVHSSGAVPIIASERTSYTPDGGVTYPSFSEMLGLPSALLTDTFYFPWYNDLNLNTELRFGLP